jgi:hypothetical protein
VDCRFRLGQEPPADEAVQLQAAHELHHDPLFVPHGSQDSNWSLIQTTDTYVIGMTLLGSVVLYGAGEIPYIDALFFASGSATQSGLNT